MALLRKTSPYAHAACKVQLAPLDFAVLPRAVGFDELVPGIERIDCGGHVGRAPVGEVVVGDDTHDAADAAAGEVVGCAEDESGVSGPLAVGARSRSRPAGSCHRP